MAKADAWSGVGEARSTWDTSQGPAVRGQCVPQANDHFSQRSGKCLEVWFGSQAIQIKAGQRKV